VIDHIVPVSNRLVIAIILYTFRNGLNLFDYSSPPKEPYSKINVEVLALSHNINEFYYRLFLLLLKYLQDAGYVVLTPSGRTINSNELSNFDVVPNLKYYNRLVKVEKESHSSVDLNSEDPYVLSSIILKLWPQMRPSVVLMMDCGLRFVTKKGCCVNKV
jgi:hypothetical protein